MNTGQPSSEHWSSEAALRVASALVDGPLTLRELSRVVGDRKTVANGLVELLRAGHASHIGRRSEFRYMLQSDQ